MLRGLLKCMRKLRHCVVAVEEDCATEVHFQLLVWPVYFGVTSSSHVMDFFVNHEEVMALSSVMLLMLMNTHQALSLCNDSAVEDDIDDDVNVPRFNTDNINSDIDCVNRAALMHFRLWNNLTFMDEEIDFWVKPRSTTWFSRFLVEEYDDQRWVLMFRMTKRAIFSLANLLAPSIRRRDTTYRLAIPVIVRVACTLFKLSHGVSLLICSEMFAVGRSTVSIMLREVVHAVNVVLRREITWPSGSAVTTTTADFQQLCGLPGVVGAIDGTHIAISKPRNGAADYFYFKSGGYSINCQVVVDSSRRFLDLYVGMPGSTNDSKMLCRSSLFFRGQRQMLWNPALPFEGFAPYLLGDGGYPVLPWLMIPHRYHGTLPVAEALFNRKLCKGRVVVENAFALLKLSFRELHLKSDLRIRFVPDVVTCCAILHNVLLRQSHQDVERLLQVLQSEDEVMNKQNNANDIQEGLDVPGEQPDCVEEQRKRTSLGLYLSLQRVVPA